MRNRPDQNSEISTCLSIYLDSPIDIFLKENINGDNIDVILINYNDISDHFFCHQHLKFVNLIKSPTRHCHQYHCCLAMFLMMVTKWPDLSPTSENCHQPILSST